jgi:hypothetical protein
MWAKPTNNTIKMFGYTIKLGKMAFILLHHVAVGLGVEFADINPFPALTH